MKRLIFTIFLLIFSKNIDAKIYDGFLLVPPALKVCYSGVGMYYSLTEKDVQISERLSVFSATALYGIPNFMLIKNVFQKKSKNISFWRKFIIWEEGISLGILNSLFLIDLINSNEDKYPSGESEDTYPEIGVILASLATSIWLLNFIPFSYEKITPQFSVNYSELYGKNKSMKSSFSIMYTF